MKSSINLAVSILLLAAANVSAATHYVSLESPNPSPPYTNWDTAATTIQQAVDAAAAGDVILVTNGVYAAGARETFESDGYSINSMGYNRVAITNAVALRSVNGPQVTVINGGATNRCIWLADGASLSGFELTNGSADYGGGVYCSTTNAVLTNCVTARNWALYGAGGVYGCTLYGCTVTSNLIDLEYGGGGGAWESTLYNCTLSGNSACYGGGVESGTLYNCTLSGNSSSYGGGASDSTLYNCTVTDNSVTLDYYGDGGYGGGAGWSSLYNCFLTRNSAPDGGGAYSSTLFNCTVTDNSASERGGGGDSWTLQNSIVYFNTAPEGANYVPQDYGPFMSYCCTTPLPTNGFANIDLDPQLASASHLSANSPCRGAGSNWPIGSDIDGEAWGNPPSIGCDEYHAGAVTGPLAVSLLASYTNVTIGYPVSFTAFIEGRTTASVWDFGDGVVVSNRPFATHAWTVPGDYAVVLRAYNESLPGGVSAIVNLHVVAQLEYYVAATSTNPQPPYASWATAATRIQDAVEITPQGDGVAVMVTNGVYAGGVVVGKPLALRSVNGPQFTLINGGGTNWCIFLTNSTSLSGFTLTNGYGSYGAGVWCSSTNAFLTNCVIAGNKGNGALYGTFYNCTLTGNSAAYSGAGVWGGTLFNCVLSGNASQNAGGGASACILHNCVLTGNSAPGGSGAYGSTLYNCTVTANDSGNGYGTAVAYCTLYNCIVYFNAALGGANYSSDCVLNYCCTTPFPTNGVGNRTPDPQLASASHLSAVSPCRGMGNPAYATGTDIDGEVWNNPPSIGCDEYHVGAVTGPLTVNLRANYTFVKPGCAVAFTALIDGKTTATMWDFGDGLVVSNCPWTSRAWTAPGDYTVVLRAYNESMTGGVSATGVVRVATQPVLYVAPGNVNASLPYASWATAAANIQQAVDTSGPGAEIVVTNGVYPGNLAVNKPLALRSVNGPQFTVIDGGGATRCASVTNGASLTGFTLTNGYAFGESGGGVSCSWDSVLNNCTLAGNVASYGGGAYWGTLNNCTLSGNWVQGYYYSRRWPRPGPFYSPGEGGGAYLGTLNNCTLSGNWSSDYGGGAASSALRNCTLVDNFAMFDGGGAAFSTLANCILAYNNSWTDENYADSALDYCCTTPTPTNGTGNITVMPRFVDYTNGNLRLQSNSPCINAGSNSYLTDSYLINCFDLDGNPRFVSGTVDIGAYEYQGTGSRISYAWLQQFGLPTDGSADLIDSDYDGHNNWQEWVCGTCPTNASSALRLLSAMPTSTNVTVSWQSAAGINYLLERSANLAVPFALMATNIVGQADTTSYADTNVSGPGPFFYRVSVICP